MRNLQIVDGIVREAEKLVSDFYEDNSTSFIFTADHGASAVGNHGDGRECFIHCHPHIALFLPIPNRA